MYFQNIVDDRFQSKNKLEPDFFSWNLACQILLFLLSLFTCKTSEVQKVWREDYSSYLEKKEKQISCYEGLEHHLSTIFFLLQSFKNTVKTKKDFPELFLILIDQ